jgi:hypothetical protein
MVDYRQRRDPKALIIGLLVFILAMAITFSDVYGLERFDLGSPGDNSEGITKNETEQTSATWQENIYLPQGNFYDPALPVNTEPPAVPEPTTLTLLALGCGALLARKRKASS